MKGINKEVSSTKARIRFQLGHTCGVTVFSVLEQEGIERGCGEIFKGSNGWKVVSGGYPNIYLSSNRLNIRGIAKAHDNNTLNFQDLNKEIYNSILETFKELGSLGSNPPKEGDKVLVRDSDDEEWEERIYITTLPDKCEYPFIVVSDRSKEDYLKGYNYFTAFYTQMKPIHENTFKEIREGILGEDLGTVFEVEFCLEGLKD